MLHADAAIQLRTFTGSAWRGIVAVPCDSLVPAVYCCVQGVRGERTPGVAPLGAKPRPGLRVLASPFALRAGAAPANIIPNFLDNTSNLTHNTPSVREVPQSTSSCTRPSSAWTPLIKLVPFSSLGLNNVFCTTLPDILPLGHIFPFLRQPRIAASSAAANDVIDAQDSQEEECQEGNPVLSDGLRCLRNRYVHAAPLPTIHQTDNSLH